MSIRPRPPRQGLPNTPALLSPPPSTPAGTSAPSGTGFAGMPWRLAASPPRSSPSACRRAILTPEAQQRLAHTMRSFVERCGWNPIYLKPVAGTLAYTKYGWFTRWMMKRIAAKMGGDTDTTRDHEYTDWADLRAFAREFLVSSSVKPPQVRVVA